MDFPVLRPQFGPPGVGKVSESRPGKMAAPRNQIETRERGVKSSEIWGEIYSEMWWNVWWDVMWLGGIWQFVWVKYCICRPSYLLCLSIFDTSPQKITWDARPVSSKPLTSGPITQVAEDGWYVSILVFLNINFWVFDMKLLLLLFLLSISIPPQCCHRLVWHHWGQMRTWTWEYLNTFFGLLDITTLRRKHWL